MLLVIVYLMYIYVYVSFICYQTIITITILNKLNKLNYIRPLSGDVYASWIYLFIYSLKYTRDVSLLLKQ